MSYITLSQDGLKCSHPMVAKIWETGGYTNHNVLFKRIHILLIDGRRMDFIDQDDPSFLVEKRFSECEQWLSSLDLIKQQPSK